MLSYQHAYHAGNPADLHKHAVLAALVAGLTTKPRGITVMESHAGRGLYRLDAPEAVKTGEAARGIGRATPPGGPFRRAIEAVRAAHGPAAYPGSPLVAAALLRPQDRLALCELHPAEHTALKAAMAGTGAAIHRRDGHEGLPALCPPKPRRGLALIDPSYEVKDEYMRAAETALAVLGKWPEGVVLLWYPLLPEGRHAALLERIARAGAPRVVQEVAFAEAPRRGMTGSGLVLLNPPYGAEALIGEALEGLGAALRPR